MDVEPIAKNRHFQKHKLMLNRMKIAFLMQIFIKTIYIHQKLTLANIEILTRDALKSNSPYRLGAAVVAANVFVFDVLIDIVSKLEEFPFLFMLDAFMAEIVIRYFF